jgi:hypothetical protein
VLFWAFQPWRGGPCHAALRAEWFASNDTALDTDDILADPDNDSVTTK